MQIVSEVSFYIISLMQMNSKLYETITNSIKMMAKICVKKVWLFLIFFTVVAGWDFIADLLNQRTIFKQFFFQSALRQMESAWLFPPAFNTETICILSLKDEHLQEIIFFFNFLMFFYYLIKLNRNQSHLAKSVHVVDFDFKKEKRN